MAEYQYTEGYDRDDFEPEPEMQKLEKKASSSLIHSGKSR